MRLPASSVGAWVAGLPKMGASGAVTALLYNSDSGPAVFTNEHNEMVFPSSNDFVRLRAGMPEQKLDVERDPLERFALDVVIFTPDRLERQRLQPGHNSTIAWR